MAEIGQAPHLLRISVYISNHQHHFASAVFDSGRYYYQAINESELQDVMAEETLKKRKRSVGPYGFTESGKKKRILLNAFDMNGIGHTR